MACAGRAAAAAALPVPEQRSHTRAGPVAVRAARAAAAAAAWPRSLGRRAPTSRCRCRGWHVQESNRPERVTSADSKEHGCAPAAPGFHLMIDRVIQAAGQGGSAASVAGCTCCTPTGGLFVWWRLAAPGPIPLPVAQRVCSSSSQALWRATAGGCVGGREVGGWRENTAQREPRALRQREGRDGMGEEGQEGWKAQLQLRHMTGPRARQVGPRGHCLLGTRI